MARPDKFLLGLGTIALGLLLGFAVFEAVVLLPVMTYSFRSPDSQRECTAIRPGMGRGEVLNSIHRRTSPLSEYVAGSTMIFSRATNACVVEFDPNTNIVISAKVDPNRRTGAIGEQYLSQ